MHKGIKLMGNISGLEANRTYGIMILENSDFEEDL